MSAQRVSLAAPRWVICAINAAERGDAAELEATMRQHWEVEEIFLLLKTAAAHYGMTAAEMAEELQGYLERHEARQTRH